MTRAGTHRGRSAAAAAIAVLGGLLWAHPAAAGPQRYLILPFENLSSERSLNWLGEALAMSLADRFEALGMRTVTREERLDALETLSLPAGTPLTLATHLRVAGVVRAGMIVTGTYRFAHGDGATVTARLLNVLEGRQVWEGSRPGTLAGIFGLMDPLVLEAVSLDRARMSQASPSALGAISDPPLPLYEVIVRGIQEPDPDRRVAALEKGLGMNRQAPALLRALAPALFDAGRHADALARLDAIPDGAVPDAWRLHLLRARILMAREDVEGARDALARSISAGDSAEAHLLLARMLAGRGERERARAELDLAAGLDPGHPEIPDVKDLLSGAHLRPEV